MQGAGRQATRRHEGEALPPSTSCRERPVFGLLGHARDSTFSWVFYCIFVFICLAARYAG